GVELTIGLDHQLETGQRTAAAQYQGRIEAEDLGGDQTDGAGGKSVWHGHLTHGLHQSRAVATRQARPGQRCGSWSDSGIASGAEIRNTLSRPLAPRSS